MCKRYSATGCAYCSTRFVERHTQPSHRRHLLVGCPWLSACCAVASKKTCTSIAFLLGNAFQQPLLKTKSPGLCFPVCSLSVSLLVRSIYRACWFSQRSTSVMQAGFGMLEVGSVGAKHTKNLLIKVRFCALLSSSSKLHRTGPFIIWPL